MIYSLCYRFYTGISKEVNHMDLFASLIVTIMGGVICHYIIKCLDGDM